MRTAFLYPVVVLSLVGCRHELAPAESDAGVADATPEVAADSESDVAPEVAPDTCECKPGETMPVTGTCPAALEKRTKTCTSACVWGDDVCALPKGWTRIADAPASIAGRLDVPAVWTGGELIVFGGAALPDILEGTNDGAIYSLQKNTWTALPTTTAAPRKGHTAVWTGRYAIFFGGADGFSAPYADTVIYDPLVKAWEYPGTGPLSGRTGHSAVFAPTTGEMIVWGGGTAGDGAAFDVGKQTWTMLPAAPISPRWNATMFWTGTEVLIWGGSTSSGPVRDGALFNPTTRSWRLVPNAPVAARDYPRVAATGGDLFFFGGDGDPIPFDGARLSLASLSWSALPTPAVSLLPPRLTMQAWAGSDRFFVWGGSVEEAGAPKPLADGAIFDPKMGVWTALSAKDAPAGRGGAVSVWTGKAGLVWGGLGAPGGGALEALADGAIYVP